MNFVVRPILSVFICSLPVFSGNKTLSARYAQAGGETTDANWTGIGQSQGLQLTDDDHLLAMFIDPDNRLFVAGNFLCAGGTPVFNIARWDGIGWGAIGTSTVMRMVTALAGDTGGVLYTAGWYQAGANDASCRVVKWNGSDWTPVTAAIIGNIYALVFDGQNRLYASGDFDTAGGVIAHNVACWEDDSWHPLGNGTNNRTIALALDGRGNLYAGGYFDSAGTSPAGNIAMWDGDRWNTLNGGIRQVDYERRLFPVITLAIDTNDRLYAGGDFDSAGSAAARNIAVWNGTSWSSLGQGIRYTGEGSVNALAFTRRGTLYAAGQFDTAGSAAARNIACWDGVEWKTVSSGINGKVVALDTDTGDLVYATGFFTGAGGQTVDNIACWDGTAWRAVGNIDGRGLNGKVAAITATGSGDILFGGTFTTVGCYGINRVCRISGNSWNPLGTGQQGSVTALAADPQGAIYSVNTPRNGQFTIEKWTGTAWNTIATCTGHSVTSLAIDGSGVLWAAGLYASLNGSEAENIAVWDGRVWFPSSAGASVDNAVNAIVPVNGDLYLAGDFETAAAIPARSIVNFTGNEWKALAEGIAGRVFALAADSSGNLYAGGLFTSAGSVTVRNIARWDGTVWEAMGNGINGMVTSLTVSPSGSVYGGGDFDSAGDTAASNIARWNGSRWQPLGSGTDNTVHALCFDTAGDLYVGGAFIRAGGKLSPYLAVFSPDGPRPIAVAEGTNLHPAVFFNPRKATLRLTVTGSTTAGWSVFNGSGRRMAGRTVALQAGTYEIPVRSGPLAPGLYIVKCSAGSLELRQPFIVMR